MALRRDVIRFRRSRKRWNSWDGARGRLLPGLAARFVVPAAVLLAALALVIWLAGRGGHPAQPQATPTPSAAPSPSASPTAALVPGRPEATGMIVPATAAPTQPVVDMGEFPPAEPVRSVSSREELIRLYWWMIFSGTDTARLDELSLPESDIAEVTDKFSNYFEAYACDAAGEPEVTVVFKTGVRVLAAMQQDRTGALRAEEQVMALQARDIVKGLVFEGMTDVEKELAIHDYIIEHCAYLAREQGFDTGSARGFFESGLCQCVGYADTFRLLARLAGLEVEMIGGPTTRDLAGSKGHAWNLIRLDGLWYVVDLTWDDMAGENTLEHTFFNLPCTAFGATRSWDQSCTPSGTYASAVDGKYYYSRPGFAAGSAAEALELAARQADADGQAYVYFLNGDESEAVAAGLSARGNGGYRARELSEDLNIDLYKFVRQ